MVLFCSMFTDETTITVKGGRGGNGCTSWRREKYVEKGGPDGGDGGKGGDVILRVSVNTDTLSLFSRLKSFHAANGRKGEGKRKRGKGGDNLILPVPPGTVVREERGPQHHIGCGAQPRRPRDEDTIVADLQKEGDEVIVARGGRGGYGNAHFTSSIRQRPDFAELGEPGEERTLHLELKLIADVAIIGEPNVGKSTLIATISSAKPKIAPYPFTTIVPNLGVVTVRKRLAGRSSAMRSECRSFVACDIPGLIEGAAEGKGLGHTFLRHIERCSVLVHLLDVSREDLEGDYAAIRKELEKYSPTLAKKCELVVLSKIDLIGGDCYTIKEQLKRRGIDVFTGISSVTHEGIEDLKRKLLPIVLKERGQERATVQRKSSPILRPHLEGAKTGAFIIEVEKDKTWRATRITVHGRRIEQIAVMTNLQSPGGVRRLQDVCERSGLIKALQKAGADAKTKVFIGKTEVTGYLL
jgi:GTP-binding protein